MSGVDIIGALVRASVPVTSLVPIERIKAGALPDDATLDAILLRSVSRSEWQPLKQRASVRVNERVAVTVRATSFRRQEQLLELIRSACRGALGTIAGAQRVAVLTAGTGPDVRGPNNSFEKTQDFRVSFEA